MTASEYWQIAGLFCVCLGAVIWLIVAAYIAIRAFPNDDYEGNKND